MDTNGPTPISLVSTESDVPSTVRSGTLATPPLLASRFRSLSYRHQHIRVSFLDRG
jgi:hypothetical protein